MKNIAIITAGGSGKRLPGKVKKQFLLLKGRPVLFWTIDKFYYNENISKIILVLPKAEIIEFEQMVLKEYEDDKFLFVEGGKERQDSVFNGLNACPSNTDYVLIHDGVRPFISKKEIMDLLQFSYENKAVIPVTKMKNTIKSFSKNIIKATIPRDQLLNVHTPQVFDYNLILKCHEKAYKENKYFTDDASILENYNYPVFVKFCSYKNIKITEPNDLILAEVFLKDF